jgi:hypothetical protein
MTSQILVLPHEILRMKNVNFGKHFDFHVIYRFTEWPTEVTYWELRLFTVVGFITLFPRRPHRLCNWMKYPLSVKSFISLFPKLISVIKYNDVMVKYPLSNETIWLTTDVLFRFIRLENGLAPCHRDDTALFSSLINLMSCQQKIWCVMIINIMKPPWNSYCE